MTPNSPQRASWLTVVWAALALFAGGFIIVVAADTSDDGQGHKRHTVTVTLGGPGEKKIPLTPPAQQIVAEQKAEDAAGKDVAAESDLRDTIAPLPEAQELAQKKAPVGQPPIPAHVPLATVHEPGCTTALVRNYSSRRSDSKILFGLIHWTGSRPTVSSASGLAIVRWFDLPAAQASSNYITDQSGRCWLTVPETKKAWTQAGANEWAVSDEIVNLGVQPLLQTAAARARVVKLMVGWHHRWGIPYRRGLVAQGGGYRCIPVRSGFMAHRDLGVCGGGHPDVGTFDLAALIAEARRADTPAKLTKRQKWEARHLTTHKGLAGCRSAAARKRAKLTDADCRALRVKNRAYHRLLK